VRVQVPPPAPTLSVDILKNDGDSSILLKHRDVV